MLSKCSEVYKNFFVFHHYYNIVSKKEKKKSKNYNNFYMKAKYGKNIKKN